MILSFKRNMTNNYMVPEVENTLSPEDYQIHMLLENHIEGLLGCTLQKVNGQIRYFYDITSRQSMESIYEKEWMSEKDIRIFLKGLYLALTESRRYLLHTGRVMLKPDMIYMDVETREPLFCYLPVYKGDILESFHTMTEYILRHLDQSDKKAVLMGYELYRQSMEENYSLEKLLKKAVYEGGETPTKEVWKVEQTVEMVVPEKEKREYITEKPSEKRKTEPQEKTGIKSHQTQKDKKLLIEAGILLLLFAGIGFAAWYLKMNTTQLGGIVFLLAGFLGYGISAEKKRKKSTEEIIRKREEQADKKSRKKQEQIEKKQPVPVQKNMVQKEKKEAPQETEQERIGATVLLYEGEEEYEPHLSLISMNPRERNSIVLLKDSYTIGKLKNRSDIYIDDPSISRIHARIDREGNEYFLCDLNSTNGTYVNGQRLSVNERVQIRLSDEIRFAELGYYVGKC